MVEWGRYQEAYKAIWDKLDEILAKQGEGLRDIAFFTPIINPEAEDGLRGWVPNGDVESSTVSPLNGEKCWVFKEEADLMQFDIRNIPTSEIEEFSIGLKIMKEGQWMGAEVVYSEGDSDITEFVFPTPTAWTRQNITTKPNRHIIAIIISAQVLDDYAYADSIFLRLRSQLYVGTKPATPKIIDLTATGVIYSPASGKKIRLLAFVWSSNADVVTALRFGTTGDLLFAIQAKGVVGMNLFGCSIEGAVDQALYGYLSGTGTMKGSVIIEEI